MKKNKLLILIFLILNIFCINAYAQISEEEETKLADVNNTEINVKDADILSLVRIFSKKIGRNYILDERVKGKVSIYLPAKVSEDEATSILDSVLALKGFTSVPIKDNIWKIVPSNEAQKTTIPLIEETIGEGSALIVTRFINLKHVNADDVKQLISPLISSSGLVNAYTGTNSLIMIDHENNIQRLMKIIDNLDIPFTDREMSIIPITHAEAGDIAEKVNQILLDTESGKSQGTTSSTNNNIRLSNTSSSSRSRGQVKTPTNNSLTVSARSLEPKIIADERTNSIIIVADDTTTARIKALVTQLDSQLDLSGNKFYVYRCQHANAEELSEVLSNLVTGNSDSENSASGTNSRNNAQVRTPGTSRNDSNPLRRTANGGNNTVDFGDGISVTADPATNSLIIVASKTDYKKIKLLLKDLDIKRRQVLVEATLLEVTVNEDVSLSNQFLGSGGNENGGVLVGNNAGSLASIISNPTQLSQFTVAAASAGTLKLPGGFSLPTQSIITTAAKNNSNVNVLSAPTILATDNEEAEIVVGQNVPFLTSTASSTDNLNNVFNQIDRQDVGITLRITPQISSSDFVTLKLFTEVSSVVSGTQNSELGPTTTVRTSNTTVITKDSQMVVIGGLMSDDITESESGVPYLKEIPILGHLFRDRTDRQSKTNLLIFITPKIIENQFDARDMTIDHKSKVQSEIDRNNFYPDRADILESKDLDNVAQAEIWEGEKPGTILPPIEKEPRFEAQDFTNNSKSDDINLKVKASFGHQDSENQEKTQDEVTEGSKFISLIATGKYQTQEKLPFDPKGEKLIVILPKDITSKAKEYFKQGNKYYYSLKGNNIEFEVVNIYDTHKEFASKEANYTSKPYKLTPYEVLNLGKGPWRESN